MTWLGIKAFGVFVVVFFGSSWLLFQAEIGDAWAPFFGFWVAAAASSYYYKQNDRES